MKDFHTSLKVVTETLVCHRLLRQNPEKPLRKLCKAIHSKRPSINQDRTLKHAYITHRKGRKRDTEKRKWGNKQKTSNKMTGSSSDDSVAKNPPAVQDTLRPPGGKMPWRKKWQPTPVFLPRKAHGQRSRGSYRPWGCKKLDRTEQLSTHLYDTKSLSDRQGKRKRDKNRKLFASRSVD